MAHLLCEVGGVWLFFMQNWSSKQELVLAHWIVCLCCRSRGGWRIDVLLMVLIGLHGKTITSALEIKIQTPLITLLPILLQTQRKESNYNCLDKINVEWLLWRLCSLYHCLRPNHPAKKARQCDLPRVICETGNEARRRLKRWRNAAPLGQVTKAAILLAAGIYPGQITHQTKIN